MSLVKDKREEACAQLEEIRAKLRTLQDSVSELETMCENLESFLTQKKRQKVRKTPELIFHDVKKGDKIQLSDQQKRAERTDAKKGHGIVLSCEPMKVNHLYEVRLEKRDGRYSPSEVSLGVLTENPEKVTLPAKSDLLLKKAIVIHPNWVMENGNRTNTPGPAETLRGVKEGDRVGLLVDKTRTLHLYINSHCKAAISHHVPNKCHFMVDLHATWREVIAIPVKRMK